MALDEKQVDSSAQQSIVDSHSQMPESLADEKLDAVEMKLEGLNIDVDTSAENDMESGEQEDKIEYPASWKLALITIALCLSVFCMALVRPTNQ